MLSDLCAGGRPGLHVPQAPPAQKILPGRTNFVTLKMYRRYFYRFYFLTKKCLPFGKVKNQAMACRRKKKCVFRYLIEAGDWVRGECNCVCARVCAQWLLVSPSETSRTKTKNG